MTTHRKLQDFISSSLAEDNGIWQMNLLSEKKLGELSTEKALHIYWAGDDIRKLWQIGLVRADLIYSQSKIEIENIELIKSDDNGKYIYKDVREFSNDGITFAGVFKNLQSLPSDIELFFSPIQVFVSI